MNGRQCGVLKVSYAVSRLFCKMLFVLCNVKLAKYRCHGMKVGMTRASFSATDAPWETACIQGMVADISASHTLVRQPLLRISCPWRSRGQPCPALLHIHCAWEVHRSCSRVNEDWVNTLHWIQPGSVLVVQTLYLWIATDCNSEESSSWNTLMQLSSIRPEIGMVCYSFVPYKSKLDV